MAKYIKNPLIEKTEQGKRYYTSVVPQSYVENEMDGMYTTQLGDRWDLLAHTYYGDSRYWYVLARANNNVDGSIFINPGTKIIIPRTV